MSRIARTTIIDALRAALEATPAARAAFLGGSDATGRTDEHSDIDLVVIVDDGAVEQAFLAVHAALQQLSPISHRWRVPEPAWHGHSQEFLALRDADPAHFVDLLVMRATAAAVPGGRFLEPARHGQPIVLFDRDGLIAPDPLDLVQLDARIAERLEVLRERFPLFQTLITRAVRRGFVAEAAVAYQDLALRPLIELLRIRHCPERFDYGARYLDRDLPAGVRSDVESLALPATLDQVESFRARAAELFDITLAELDRDRAQAPPAPTPT